MLIGDDKAQRRDGAKKAQQEDGDQFAASQPETPSRTHGQCTRKQRRDAPAVGQRLERRIAPGEQQREERRQSEGGRRQRRIENTFCTFHKTDLRLQMQKIYPRLILPRCRNCRRKPHSAQLLSCQDTAANSCNGNISSPDRRFAGIFSQFCRKCGGPAKAAQRNTR